MSIFKTVGKRGCLYNTCPICGKPDWCYTFDSYFNGKTYRYLVCNRYTQTSNVQNFYYIGRTKEGGSKFIITSESYGGDYTHSKVEFKRNYERMPDRKLHLLNTILLDNLKLEDFHREKLNKDGITDEMIEAAKIRSFPCSDRERKLNGKTSINPTRAQLARELLIAANGDLSGFPGAYLVTYKDNSYWTLAGHEGIVFPISNVYGERIMLQMRLDHPTIDEKTGKEKNKYKVFSSESDIRADGSQYMKNGIGPSSRIGLVVPKTLKDSYVCYITEGYKKAKVASHKLGSLFVTVQGVNAYSDLFSVNERGERPVDVLKNRYGVGMFIVMYDNDKFHNEKVLFSEQVLINCLIEEEFMVATATWDSYCGKGIDDLFNNNYGTQYIQYQLVKS